jgi:hypothetical protein
MKAVPTNRHRSKPSTPRAHTYTWLTVRDLTHAHAHTVRKKSTKLI